MAELFYVTKIMKRVLGLKGRSKWMNERSHQFLKLAEMEHDHSVENGGNWSLMITGEKAEKLENFYRNFLKHKLYEELNNVKETK